MPRLLVLLGCALVLAGCANPLTAHRLAVCDGKQRRPANVYPSVLPGPPSPPPAADKLSAAPTGAGSC